MALPEQYFEAGPALKSNPTQFTGNPISILSGQTWLNQLDKNNHGSHAYTTTSTLEWQTGFAQSNCSALSAVATNAARYPDNKTTYGLLGPNSNSFTHSLLTLSGITVPVSISADLTIAAPGWGTTIKW